MQTITEERFTLHGIPGIRWTPPDADDTCPVILLGHPGDLERMAPRLAGRARRAAADGFATATLELPGAGTRPPLEGVEAARADLRRALADGRPVDDDIIDRLVLPLVEAAAPEWSALLDDLGAGRPAGYSGGFISIGVRLALADPRVAALGLFAGSFVPRTIIEEARRVAVPVHVLLQWDDEGNDRARSLELFDAFGSAEKTLQANLGGHTGVPAFAGDDAARFFARHLRPAAG
jgi:hypothetical protein